MAGFTNSICTVGDGSKCISFQKIADNTGIDAGKKSEYEYPKNTRPLENQVAGHEWTSDYGKIRIGMLKHEDGYVMKPAIRPIQGEREIKFYEQLKHSADPVLSRFKTFIPEYYGTSILDVKGTEIKFLLLKDMTHGFKEPCIMDVKIGKQTWEPGAPLEKEKSEKTKYTESKNSLSFCIPGFQLYNLNSKKYSKFGKDYGKQLNASGVYEALKIFFNYESGASKHILPLVLCNLRTISEWFKNQRIIHMYSSSILIAYDAAVLRQLNVPDKVPCESLANDNDVMFLPGQSRELWYCVSLIDFPHVVPAGGVLDSNYITGIDSLINVLENILSS